MVGLSRTVVKHSFLHMIWLLNTIPAHRTGTVCIRPALGQANKHSSMNEGVVPSHPPISENYWQVMATGGGRVSFFRGLVSLS